MAPELITDKLRKIKELAENGGTFGERQAASQALRAMLEKHGLTMDDLLAGDRKMRVFTVKMADKDLFICCYHKVVGWGDKRPMYRPTQGKGRATQIEVELSSREYADVCTTFDFYRSAFTREKLMFFRAFITKHGLAKQPDADMPEENMSDSDRDAAIAMMRAMRSHQNPLTTAQIGHKA